MNTTLVLPTVTLKARKALPFFKRHPWVFSGAINRVEGEPQPGDQVRLASHKGEFIANGLYNPHSNIRVRLYCWEENRSLDQDFWSQRIDAAIEMRRRLFTDAESNAAYRLIYSEADGLSGLIVDRYGDWLIVQFTSLALATHSELILDLLTEKLQPAGIWLRTEKGIREAEGLTISDGLVRGEEPPRPMFIEENGVRFGVDLQEGQKTGFYCDQRDNRLAVSRYVKDHRVLDLFCYVGGFGLTAVLRGEAKEVLGIDVSATALQLATANAELNGVSQHFRFEKAKAFEALEQLNEAGEKFDTVILDPPKLTRHRKGLKKALRGYHALNQLAVNLLNPGGILVTCSCSGLVTSDVFEEMLSDVSIRTNRAIRMLEIRGQAADHPTSVHCRETNYLKCYICAVS